MQNEYFYHRRTIEKHMNSTAVIWKKISQNVPSCKVCSSCSNKKSKSDKPMTIANALYHFFYLFSYGVLSARTRQVGWTKNYFQPSFIPCACCAVNLRGTAYLSGFTTFDVSNNLLISSLVVRKHYPYMGQWLVTTNYPAAMIAIHAALWLTWNNFDLSMDN